MKLDKKALENLQGMSDTQLKFIINKLASDYGLDLSAFNISGNDIQSIRKALAGATDEDIARATEQLSRNRGGGK